MQEPHSVVVSARTGAGLDELAEAVEAALPRWDREVSAVVPYVRGDLVARAHQEGEVLALRHCAGRHRADRPRPAGPGRRDRPHCRSGGRLTRRNGRYPGSGAREAPGMGNLAGEMTTPGGTRGEFRRGLIR